MCCYCFFILSLIVAASANASEQIVGYGSSNAGSTVSIPSFGGGGLIPSIGEGGGGVAPFISGGGGGAPSSGGGSSPSTGSSIDGDGFVPTYGGGGGGIPATHGGGGGGGGGSPDTGTVPFSGVPLPFMPPSGTVPFIGGTPPSGTVPFIGGSPPAGTVPSNGAPPTRTVPTTNPAPTGCSCNFWATHPQLWPHFLSCFSTVAKIFGGIAPRVFGSATTLIGGLKNTANDPFYQLLREGTAALLNSYTHRHFPFTPQFVKARLNSALVSRQAAAIQAAKFARVNGNGRQNYCFF